MKRKKSSDHRSVLRKVWHFIWEDDSPLSWIVNIVLAFVLIKFIVYPGLGFLLGTTHPIVAVVSGSMEHGAPVGSSGLREVCGNVLPPDVSYNGRFDSWWQMCGDFYAGRGITRQRFLTFPYTNGFNKGDIMVLVGADAATVTAGQIIVFKPLTGGSPIIHRVVATEKEANIYYLTTKGDHNPAIFAEIGENRIGEDRLIGRTVMRIPYLGYIKIWFVDLLRLVGIAR
jgi:signal peptidase I